jgi:uncharacterized protein
MIARFAMRNVVAALVALTAFGVAGPAASQSPTPGALLIAKQIVQLKGVDKMMDPIARGIVEKVKNVVMQTNFMFQKDINEVTDQLHKEFDGRSAELVDITARNYASRFSEPELKQILTFYQSPVGQKMIVQEPQIIDESLKQADGWADNLSVDVMAKMRSELKKRGHDI